MKNGLPLRRGQLVTTFGPGSLVVSPDGDTSIIGALDKWYFDAYQNKASNIGEFEVQEPRLKALLNVDRLLLPPDYRPSYRYKKEGVQGQQPNMDLVIPLLRFPSWHYCPKCKTLQQSPMTNRSSYLDCKECQQPKVMSQVPFVIVCSHGHIGDFPWREWVHADEKTMCDGRLKLTSTGGTTLDSMKVKCSACNVERSLKGIMTRSVDGDDNGVSVLSRTLNKNGEYFNCPGTRPWFGNQEETEPCAAYPMAVLKNATNVYSPRTISAIHLPGENLQVEQLIKMFQNRQITAAALELQEKMENKIKFVKMYCPPSIEDFADDDIQMAITYMESSSTMTDSTEVHDKWVERELRRNEFKKLQENEDAPDLKIINEWTQTRYDRSDLRTVFSKINRVTRLKQTIVLTGFGRLQAFDHELGLITAQNGRKQIFIEPDKPENNWLPAYCVYGEGIFVTVNSELIDKWEQHPKVQKYFKHYLKRVYNAGRKNESLISPSYIMLHTLAHLIIDQLVITCGYNSTSLRERLYLEKNQAGILIYTSSGDVEGTFGGLVRMGKAKEFFPVIEKALEAAEWCSSDPVCTEIGTTEGQGLQQLNGAACHSCSYLPETSCELVNLYLDRALLVNQDFGFFPMIRNRL